MYIMTKVTQTLVRHEEPPLLNTMSTSAFLSQILWFEWGKVGINCVLHVPTVKFRMVRKVPVTETIERKARKYAIHNSNFSIFQ